MFKMSWIYKGEIITKFRWKSGFHGGGGFMETPYALKEVQVRGTLCS